MLFFAPLLIYISLVQASIPCPCSPPSSDEDEKPSELFVASKVNGNENTNTLTDSQSSSLFSRLNQNILVKIANYLSCPHENLGFVTDFARETFFKTPLFSMSKMVSFRYSVPEMINFSRCEELYWFTQQGSNLPFNRKFQDPRFIAHLTTAHTFNKYFPHDGVLISQLLLKRILSCSPEDKAYFTNFTIPPKDSTVPKSLARFLVETHQYSALLQLSKSYPSALSNAFPSLPDMVPFQHVLESLEDVAECETILFNAMKHSIFYRNHSPSSFIAFFQVFLYHPNVITNLLAQFHIFVRFQVYFFKAFEYVCIADLDFFDLVGLYERMFHILVVEFDQAQILHPQGEVPLEQMQSFDDEEDNQDLFIHQYHEILLLSKVRFTPEDVITQEDLEFSSSKESRSYRMFETLIITSLKAGKGNTFKSILNHFYRLPAFSREISNSLATAIAENSKCTHTFFFGASEFQFDSVFVEDDTSDIFSTWLFMVLNVLIRTNCDRNVLEKIMKLCGHEFNSIEKYCKNSRSVDSDSDSESKINPLINRLTLSLKYSQDQNVIKALIHQINKPASIEILLAHEHLISESDFSDYLSYAMSPQGCQSLNVDSDCANYKVEIRAGHTAILRIYKNKDLHKIFAKFDIKMKWESILTVIRSDNNNLLKKEFGKFFEEFGRLFSFDFKNINILQYLRPNYEFKAFAALTGRDIGVYFATVTFDRKYYQKNRSAFLFALQTINSTASSMLWTKCSTQTLKLLAIDAPYDLKQSYDKYLKSSEFNQKNSESVETKFNTVFNS